MTRALILAALLLAACGRDPGPAPGSGFRDPAVSISSIALFEQSRLDGDWREVAGYPLTGAAAASYAITGRGGAIQGPGRYLPITSASLLASGPGRIAAGPSQLWVLWVDADYRTLVLGTPSGSFGAVLNRGGPISPDRLEAARRVLDFNGYDLTRLEVPQ